VHIVRYEATNFNVFTARGFIVRGAQLSKGLGENNNKVTILYEGHNLSPGKLDENVEYSTNGLTDLEKIYKQRPPDIIYLRGHNRAAEIKKKFPNSHLCLELYLSPYNFTKMDIDFKAYKYIDSFTVIGEKYHELTLNWLQKRYKAKHKPNISIFPSFDQNHKAQKRRDYHVGIFDGINAAHHTLSAVQGFASISLNRGMKCVVGTKYIKDKKIFSRISHYKKFGISFVKANILNLYDYYKRCIATYALYSSPHHVAAGSNGKIRDFVVSLRVIEGLGNGCIPIVSQTLANKEIFGEYLENFSIKEHSPSELGNKLIDVVTRKDDYIELIKQMNVNRFSNLALGEKLTAFFKSVL